MIILCVLLIAYILSVNFYSFLLIKSLRDKERAEEREKALRAVSETPSPTEYKPPEKSSGKLFIAGILGGAITIYVCMFLLKYKRSDLLLMVFMPLIGILNIYLWIVLFKSGMNFFLVR